VTQPVIDVSIVIVNWNAREYLRDCLRSIAEQTTRCSYEVIVVDNASSDGSQAMLAAEFPNVRSICSERNLGFAGGNNQGMKIARGSHVLLLNPDTLVLEGAIDACLDHLRELPEVGVLGCQVWEDEKTIQKTCFMFPSPLNILLTALGLSQKFPSSRFFGRSQMTWWDRSDERDVEVVSGMFMLVRREALEQVGMMDDSYFMYAEEADWCYRFWKAGWRCRFTPRARIMHLEGGGKSTQRSTKVSMNMYVQLQKSILQFHRKNRGIISWSLAKLVYMLVMPLRSLMCGLLMMLGKRDAWRLKAMQAFAATRYHLLRIEPQA
jgi:GT2 family glycosyltransferase